MFYYIYKNIFRGKGGIRNTLLFSFFHENCTTWRQPIISQLGDSQSYHNLVTANHITRVILVFHSTMKT